MSRRVTAVAALAALLFVTACGSARVVRRTQTGGTIALEGDRKKAMEDAHRQMQAHCQGPYTIIEEGEHVVGSETRGGQETYYTEDGTEVTEAGQSTRDAVEWRIVYECGANAPAPRQPPPPPPGPPGQPDYEDQGGYDDGGYDDDGYDERR